MVLFCHVILQDHTIKVSCDFIGGRGEGSSRQIILLSLVDTDTLVLEI